MKYVIYGLCIYIIYHYLKEEVFIQELFKPHLCKN